MRIYDIHNLPVWTYEFAAHGMQHQINSSFEIENHYVSKVRTEKYALEIPLGAKALIRKTDPAFQQLPEGAYTLQLIDVSGAVWKQDFRK